MQWLIGLHYPARFPTVLSTKGCWSCWISRGLWPNSQQHNSRPLRDLCRWHLATWSSSQFWSWCPRWLHRRSTRRYTHSPSCQSTVGSTPFGWAWALLAQIPNCRGHSHEVWHSEFLVPAVSSCCRPSKNGLPILTALGLLFNGPETIFKNCGFPGSWENWNKVNQNTYFLMVPPSCKQIWGDTPGRANRWMTQGLILLVAFGTPLGSLQASAAGSGRRPAFNRPRSMYCGKNTLAAPVVGPSLWGGCRENWNRWTSKNYAIIDPR